ncbi:MAG TPA: aminopeptidase, partial [Planctomycetaceae bacterium]|nr:aminopeptidase [Planctomycetaceae bacterium]
MSHLPKSLFIAGCVALFLLPQISPAADLPTNAAIVKRLSADLEILASDEYEGRGVGTEGLAKASIYVRDQFREAGLDVTQVEGGAFQSFKLPSGAEIGQHNALVLKGPDNQSIELKLGEDFEVCSFGGSGKIEAELVFLGYGIENKKLNYNDFEGIDVKG